MHELSIAMSLVEVAESAARDAGAARVEAVQLRVGALSGVVREALLFGYDIATRGTLLEGSRLEIEDVPVAVYCSACDLVSDLPSIQAFQCPRCGAPAGDIRRGRELEIVSVEVMAHETETA